MKPMQPARRRHSAQQPSAVAAAVAAGLLRAVRLRRSALRLFLFGIRCFVKAEIRALHRDNKSSLYRDNKSRKGGLRIARQDKRCNLSMNVPLQVTADNIHIITDSK